MIRAAGRRVTRSRNVAGAAVATLVALTALAPPSLEARPTANGGGDRRVAALEPMQRAAVPGVATRRFTGWPASLRPAFRPRRTIVAKTPRQFFRAWARLRAGDRVVVRGVSFAGGVRLWNKPLLGWAEVHFAADVRFVGGAALTHYAVSVAGVSKVRFYGGDVTNPTGAGIRLEDSSDISWWGFRVHDTAGTGFFAFGITKSAERLDLRGEVWNCGTDLSLDPHAEKGTGNHAVYLSGNGYRTSGTFIFKVHDQPVGAAVSVGRFLQDSTIEVDARRITFQARVQVGGNAIQWWGDFIRNIRVKYLFGEDLAGRVSETDGLYNNANPAGAVVIEYGRSSGGVRLSPKYAPAADGSVQCSDCR